MLGKAGRRERLLETAGDMAELTALIFDFDGTIAETERDGHRVAYNAAFEDAGVSWRWDVATYGELLAIAGGKERLDAFLSRERPDIAERERSSLVARLHAETGTELAGLQIIRPSLEDIYLGLVGTHQMNMTPLERELV